MSLYLITVKGHMTRSSEEDVFSLSAKGREGR